jgi:hypothetical protein
MSDVRPIRCALLLVLSMALACQCASSFNIGPGGARVDFQRCPPREVAKAIEEFETEVRKRKSPDESRIRAEAFVLVSRVQRLVDKPSKSLSASETRQRVDAALQKLRALPAQLAEPSG